MQGDQNAGVVESWATLRIAALTEGRQKMAGAKVEH
jgi:hypothetical protein